MNKSGCNIKIQLFPCLLADDVKQAERDLPAEFFPPALLHLENLIAAHTFCEKCCLMAVGNGAIFGERARAIR